MLVDVYAGLSVDEMVMGIARSFRAAPSLTLLDLIELAAATQRKAIRMRPHEPFVADELVAASSRLQLAAA